MAEHFGEHLTIDGYSCDYNKLNDCAWIEKFFNHVVQVLEMHKLSEPKIYRAKGGAPKDREGGWSGMVIIEESHISVHTFLAARFVSIDVYTCKNDLDQNLIIEQVKKFFLPEEIEINFIMRGKKYHNFI